MTPNPLYIDYLVTQSHDEYRIGARAILVAEARVMNPASSKYQRSDAFYNGGFESTLLRQWKEFSITVNGILLGVRDELVADDLSRHLDFVQFFDSAANGQRMDLDARNIGGVSAEYAVKLISTSNELQRQKTKNKFNATFKLQVVS